MQKELMNARFLYLLMHLKSVYEGVLLYNGDVRRSSEGI